MADDLTRQRLLQNLHDLRPDYDRALTHLEGESRQMITLVLDVWRLLGAYIPGDPPEKAVYLIARGYAHLSTLFQQYAVMEEYETKRKKLEDYDRRRDIERGS